MEYTPEELIEASELYPSLWIIQNEIKTSNGLPFEFDNHAFMYDVINDVSPLQVGLKPPQIGWSESLIVKSFYMADKKGKDIIYTLPTASDRDDMVGSKVNRIIAQNPVLMKMVRDHDTVEQKSVGNHIIHYRGTFSTKQAMMVSSDLNIHDETDASDPEVLVQYENRLQAKADGMRWYFSHPSLSGHGVDVYWQLSNKREWFIKCPSCKGEQVLTWPDNIDKERRVYVCSLCKENLPDNSRKHGKWRATSEGEFSGYHISQMMCAWITAGKIIDAFNDPLKDRQYFYNYVLGLPYIGSDDRIDPSVVLRNCVDVVNEQEGRTIIGADTGHGIHYVLMNKDGVFFFDHETTITASKDPYDVIRDHLDKFPRSIAVFDQGGDLIGVRKLQAEYPGRVFLCFYRKDRKTTELFQKGEGDKYGEVYVDRNRMMTLCVEEMRDTGRVRLNGTKDEWTEFASQWGNMYREKLEVKEAPHKDDKTLYGNEWVWKRNGPDHFAHAYLYGRVGLALFGGELATIGNASNMVGSQSRSRLTSRQLERPLDPWAAEVDATPIMRAEGNVQL
jgi:hypothetical protein